MNKAKIKRIESLIVRLEEIANEMSDQSWVDDEIDALQESFDNKSEKWQEGDKGSEAQEVIDRLDAARDLIRELSDAAEEASNSLRDALTVGE
jgi:hypothetical protein